MTPQRRVQEINDVGNRRAKAFDLSGAELAHLGQDLLLTCGRQTSSQKRTKPLLVAIILVDIRDAKLGLPEKRVGRALKDLLLFGNRSEHDLQG